jgi:hypothetical protein
MTPCEIWAVSPPFGGKFLASFFPEYWDSTNMQVCLFERAKECHLKTNYSSANLMRTAEKSFIAAGSFSLVSAREFIQLLSLCMLSHSGLCVLFLKPLCPYLLKEQVIFPIDTTVKYIFTFHLQLPLCVSSYPVISGTARRWSKRFLLCTYSVSYSQSVNPLKFSGNYIYHLHETQRKLCIWSISLTSIT